MTRRPAAPATPPGVRPGEPRPPGLAKRLRAAVMGMTTVTGIARKGFFLPYRYAGGLGNGAAQPRYEALETAFAAARPRIAAVIAAIERYAPGLEALGAEPPPAPRWSQGWFPRLDAAAAYALIRARRPGRIVEIGSGHSTRFLARAVLDGGLASRITAIDPAPRASIEGLRVEVVRKTAQQAGIAGLALEAGDVLFVDSSHIMMPGSDVDAVINRLWPRLPAGALVHFHDVFLPDGYPAAWRWRGYNEQLAVAPLISAGAAEIEFSSHYALTRMADALDGTVLARLPLVPGAVESSLWLRKRAPAPAPDGAE